MTRHVNLRAQKDAQKQLARTSLRVAFVFHHPLALVSIGHDTYFGAVKRARTEQGYNFCFLGL